MISIRVRFSEDDIRRLKAVRERLPDALLRGVTSGRNYVRARIMHDKLQGQVLHRRTGTLLRSIQEGGGPAEMTGALAASAALGTNVWYGRMWEESGMPAHTVEAIRGRALAFMWHGEQRFFRRVNIPAQGARPFVRPALEESVGPVEQLIRERIQATMSGK